MAWLLVVTPATVFVGGLLVAWRLRQLSNQLRRLHSDVHDLAQVGAAVDRAPFEPH